MDDFLPEFSNPENFMDFSELDEKTKELSNLSKEAYQLLKDNQIDQAIENFNKILELDINNNYALVGLGDAERRRNNIAKAMEYYNTCITFYPNNNYALFGLADCYKINREYQKSIDIWLNYLKNDIENITILTRIADGYRKLRDFKNSKQMYLKVLDIDKSNAYALIGLGHLHFDFKEFRDALYYWTCVLDIAGYEVDIRILTSIGNCHRKLKTFESGVHYFEQALQMDANNFYALFGLADCYRGLNKQEKSIEYWNKILDLYPDNKVIVTRLADAYRHLADYETAKKYYQKALNIEFDTYAVLGLALISKIQGDYDDAIKSLSRLIEADPRSARLYLDLADCYVEQNKKAEAIETLERFQKTGLRNYTVSEVLEKLKRSS
ncbi:MAG: tetratricopeptide repeat protein [Treponemataceae bacterium]